MFFSRKSKKNIDLLPEAEKKEKTVRIKLLTIVFSTSIISIVFVISLVVYMLNSGEVKKSEELSNLVEAKILQWQALAPTAQKVNAIKEKISVIKEVESTNQLFRSHLQKVNQLTPNGVTLSSLEVGDLSSLSIQAVTKDPSDTDQFVKLLRGDKEFFREVRITSLVKNSDEYILNLNVILNKEVK